MLCTHSDPVTRFYGGHPYNTGDGLSTKDPTTKATLSLPTTTFNDARGDKHGNTSPTSARWPTTYSNRRSCQPASGCCPTRDLSSTIKTDDAVQWASIIHTSTSFVPAQLTRSSSLNTTHTSSGSRRSTPTAPRAGATFTTYTNTIPGVTTLRYFSTPTPTTAPTANTTFSIITTITTNAITHHIITNFDEHESPII